MRVPRIAARVHSVRVADRRAPRHRRDSDTVRTHEGAKLADVNDGHRTSTIARPRNDAGRGASTSSSDSSESSTRSAQRQVPRSDLTTPIPRDKQLVQQRRGRIILGVFAFLIALAIGAALFVLPVKSWMKQKDDLATRTSELATLDAANAQLQSEVDRLQTDAGIKEAAREEIDFVEQGEERITMLPPAPLPITLPPGWPYNLISQIIALRQQDAVAAAAAQTSVVETVAEPTTVVETTVADAAAATTVASTTTIP